MIPFFWLISQTHALTPEELVTNALERHTPTQLHQSVEMIITRANGRTQVRHFELDLLRTEQTFFSRATFTAPKAVQGTVVFVHDHMHQEDKIFMYMPALKRVQPIQPRAQKNGFMGSDFNFDDLQIRPGDDASYTLLSKTETHQIVRAHFPTPEPWSFLNVQIDQNTQLPTRIDFQNEQEETEKTLTIDSHTLINGQMFPTQTTMTNHQTGSATVLRLSNIKPQADHLDEPYFHPGHMVSQ